jgi:hypothetical protein
LRIIATMSAEDDDELPRQAPPLGSSVEEYWLRRTREPDVRRVEALKRRGQTEWPWSVHISAAEFVREEPLEGELQRAVADGLRSVPGVAKVVHEDRERWIVAGAPSGEALARAAAAAIDGLAARIRAHIQSLRVRD